jgi:hypothetical protein
MQGLIKRNKETPLRDSTETIPFPYLIVASSDDAQNSLSIRLKPDNTKIWLSFAKPFKVIGDIDSVLHLKFSRSPGILPSRVEELLINNKL